MPRQIFNNPLTPNARPVPDIDQGMSAAELAHTAKQLAMIGGLAVAVWAGGNLLANISDTATATTEQGTHLDVGVVPVTNPTDVLTVGNSAP